MATSEFRSFLNEFLTNGTTPATAGSTTGYFLPDVATLGPVAGINPLSSWPIFAGETTDPRVAAPKERTAREILADERDAVASLLSKLEMPDASRPSVGEMPQGYLELANRLGMDGPALVRARVLSMLQREELVVYPSAKVKSYLDNMCEVLTQVAKPKSPAGWGRTAGVVWKWKALRTDAFFWPKKGGLGSLYEQVLPIEALGVMDRVLRAMPASGLDPKEFGWQVTEVSEYPDPFLSLIYLGSEMATEADRWVLFHWDEPGFSILK